MGFLAVALKPGESKSLSDCALTHACLIDSTTTCSIFANGRLVSHLTPAMPQRPVVMMFGSGAVDVRCEGSPGAAGVQLVGRAASSGAANGKRRRSEEEPATSEFISPPPLSRRQVAAVANEQLAATPVPAAAGATPGSSGSTRTPRLTFSPDVLVAEYYPKSCGIYPERRFEKLEAMERAQKQRALEEAAQAMMMGDDDDDDDDDVDGANFAAYHDLLRQWAMSQQASGRGGETADKLMEMIGLEEAHQQASRRRSVGGVMEEMEDEDDDDDEEDEGEEEDDDDDDGDEDGDEDDDFWDDDDDDDEGEEDDEESDDSDDDEPRIVDITDEQQQQPPTTSGDRTGSAKGGAVRGAMPTSAAALKNDGARPSALQLSLERLAVPLLATRTAIASDRNVLVAAEHAERLRKELLRMRKSGGASADGAARNLQAPVETVMLELGTRLDQASSAVSAPPATPLDTTKILLAIDGVYFELLYNGLTGGPDAAPLLGVEPPPATYGPTDAVLVRCPAAFFARSHTAKWRATQLERAEGMLSRLEATIAATPTSGPRAHIPWCATAAKAMSRELLRACRAYDTLTGSAPMAACGANTLFGLWRERSLEAIDLLHAGGVAASGAYDAVIPKGSTSKADDEPPAPPLIQKWRQMDREWPCWSLAFAVPSEAALDLLAAHAPLVEMGAGTGYWAHLLERRGVEVAAFDARPPPEALGAPRGGNAKGAASRSREQNEFHGDCPAFTSVQRGGPSSLGDPKWKDHTLLLCYPPKGQPMGALAVNHFGGSTLAHVGEWRGDTGDAKLEAALAQGWELVSRTPLPCWGDTMEDLTLWRRRAVPLRVPAVHHPVLVCDTCAKPAALNSPTGLRRCRYCRLACYCSAACAEAGKASHAAYHTAKCINVQRPLEFDGRDYHAVA